MTWLHGQLDQAALNADVCELRWNQDLGLRLRKDWRLRTGLRRGGWRNGRCEGLLDICMRSHAHVRGAVNLKSQATLLGGTITRPQLPRSAR